MDKVYADLIRKGVKAIDEVPVKIRNQVEQILMEVQWESE